MSANPCADSCSDLPAVTRCPDMMSGEACFTGTRLPVQALFDYIRAGESIFGFLSAYPFVSQAEVIGVLDHAEQSSKSLAPRVEYDAIVASAEPPKSGASVSAGV